MHEMRRNTHRATKPRTFPQYEENGSFTQKRHTFTYINSHLWFNKIQVNGISYSKWHQKLQVTTIELCYNSAFLKGHIFFNLFSTEFRNIYGTGFDTDIHKMRSDPISHLDGADNTAVSNVPDWRYSQEQQSAYIQLDHDNILLV